MADERIAEAATTDPTAWLIGHNYIDHTCIGHNYIVMAEGATTEPTG